MRSRILQLLLRSPAIDGSGMGWVQSSVYAVAGTSAGISIFSTGASVVAAAGSGSATTVVAGSANVTN